MFGVSSRRDALSVGAGLLAVLCGCAAAPVETAREVTIRQQPPCASGVRLDERASRFPPAGPPTVSFTLRNGGEQSVAYRIVVVFTQRTSTGFDVRSGTTTLTGRLAPGERTTATATDDAPEIENSTGYRADVSLSCPSE